MTRLTNEGPIQFELLCKKLVFSLWVVASPIEVINIDSLIEMMMLLLTLLCLIHSHAIELFSPFHTHVMNKNLDDRIFLGSWSKKWEMDFNFVIEWSCRFLSKEKSFKIKKN